MAFINDDPYHTKKRQAELLAMMKDIHRFLEKNQIPYCLCGGSLLGAIRHGGFIPWDDDLDIMLDRVHYERLLSMFDQCDGYIIERDLWIYRIKQKNDEETAGTQSRAMIDVFVADNVPRSKFKQRFKLVMIKMLQGMIKPKMELQKMSFFYKVCTVMTHFFGKLFPLKLKLRWYDNVSRIGNGKEADFVGCYNDIFKNLHIQYKNDICNAVELHSFEDTEFYIPISYEECLVKQYGDWRTPPAEEDRVPMHL